MVATSRHNKKIPRAGCRYISDPDRLGLLAGQLFAGSFEQLDRCRAAKRLQPEAATRFDVTARGIARRVARWVGQDDYRELQALGLVHGHYPHTLGALLDDGSLVGLPAFGIRLEFFDKGAEGGRAAFEIPRHVDQPLAVGQRLLARRPQSDTGVR